MKEKMKLQGMLLAGLASSLWSISGISGEILFKIGIISVYKEGLFKAAILTSRITAFVSILTLLILITPAKDFTIALEKKGLNPKAAFILLLSLQMIPEMTKR